MCRQRNAGRKLPELYTYTREDELEHPFGVRNERLQTDVPRLPRTRR